MSEYLIIYVTPGVGLQIQVRKTYEDACEVVKSNGGYIVKTEPAPKAIRGESER